MRQRHTLIKTCTHYKLMHKQIHTHIHRHVNKQCLYKHVHLNILGTYIKYKHTHTHKHTDINSLPLSVLLAMLPY